MEMKLNERKRVQLIQTSSADVSGLHSGALVRFRRRRNRGDMPSSATWSEVNLEPEEGYDQRDAAVRRAARRSAADYVFKQREIPVKNVSNIDCPTIPAPSLKKTAHVFRSPFL